MPVRMPSIHGLRPTDRRDYPAHHHHHHMHIIDSPDFHLVFDVSRFWMHAFRLSRRKEARKQRRSVQGEIDVGRD